MSYDKAKANFEAVVKSMEVSLKNWVESGKATQRGVDIKTDQINKLIEFYKQSEDLIKATQSREIEKDLAISKLHHNTQRLLYWCTLHRANANQVFKYPLAELKLMVQQGRRFGRKEDIEFDPDDNPFNKQNDQFNKQTEKYLTTRQQCSKK